MTECLKYVCISVLMNAYRDYMAIQGKGVALSWRQRSIILKDVCRGLSWLHAANPPVIHGDVKM